MSDRIRAELAGRDLYRVSSELSAEVRKRRAAEAAALASEAEAATLRLYVGVLEALLETAEERACNGGCYSALVP